MYAIDNLKDKFSILTGEEKHNFICDNTVNEHITIEIIYYIETNDKKCLINAGAMIMSMYVDMCTKNKAGYEPISWASMREFSHYPLIQRVKLFLEVWNRTDNTIFMIELYELLSEIYHK